MCGVGLTPGSDPEIFLVRDCPYGEEDDMKKRQHTAEQIVRKLREADRIRGEGSMVVFACKV